MSEHIVFFVLNEFKVIVPGYLYGSLKSKIVRS